MNVREATRADVPAIVRLLADDVLGAARETPAESLPTRYWTAFEAIERDPNNRLIVVEEAGAVVGCLQLTFIPGLSFGGGTQAQIESVRIAASHRGRGYGDRAIRWAVGEARAHGCRLVQLSTNKVRKDAIRFYERLGFVASHEGMKLDLG